MHVLSKSLHREVRVDCNDVRHHSISKKGCLDLLLCPACSLMQVFHMPEVAQTGLAHFWSLAFGLWCLVKLVSSRELHFS